MRWDDWLMAGMPLLALGLGFFLLGRQLGLGSPLRRPFLLGGVLLVVLLAPAAMGIRLVNVYQRGVLDGIHAATAAACRNTPPWALDRPGATPCPGQPTAVALPSPEQRL